MPARIATLRNTLQSHDLAAIDPLDLYVNPATHFLDAKRSTLNQLSDNTGSASGSGNPVGYFSDIKGAHNAIQATAGSRPVLITPDGILNGQGINFTGSKWLGFTGWSSGVPDHFHFFIELYMTSFSNIWVLGRADPGGSSGFIVQSTSFALSLGSGVSGNNNNGTVQWRIPLTINTRYLIQVIRRNNTLFAWINGLFLGAINLTDGLNERWIIDQIGMRAVASSFGDVVIQRMGYIPLETRENVRGAVSRFLGVSGLVYGGGDGWIVDPLAVGGGQGNAANPLTVAEAFSGAGGRIIPGQIVSFKPGTNYQLLAATNITPAGNASQKIIFRPLTDGSLVEIDQFTKLLQTIGAYQRFENLTFKSTNADRVNPDNNDLTLSQSALGNLLAASPFYEFLNCRFKDLVSFGAFESGWGSLIGCLIQNMGVDEDPAGTPPGFPQGQSFYSQNDANGVVSHRKVMKACILIHSARGSWQTYGSGSSSVDGYEVTDNIIGEGECTIGNTADTDDCTNSYNNWLGALRVGYNSKAQKNITFDHETVGAGLQIIQFWDSFTFNNGIVYQPSAIASVIDLSDVSWTTYPTKIHMDNNVYIVNAVDPFWVEGGSRMTLAQWRIASGQDAHSSHYLTFAAAILAGAIGDSLVQFHAVPSGGRHIANVFWWNYNSRASVNMDFSALGLVNGHTYELRQVEDYGTDRRGFTYSGAVVSVSSTSTFARYNGYPAPYHPDMCGLSYAPTRLIFELWDTTGL